MCYRLSKKQYISGLLVSSPALLLDRQASSECAASYWTLKILNFLQVEGLWQPCIKQLYQRHFSNRRWLAFFSNKVCTMCFLRQCYCTLTRLQDSVSVTFIPTRKPKNSWVSVYCDILFTQVVQNQICHISKVCLDINLKFHTVKPVTFFLYNFWVY